MDFQTYMDRSIKAMRAAEFAMSDQLSLGQIIDECKAIAAKRYERIDGSSPCVSFDFENARPTKFDSWRGVYAELAIGFGFDGEMPLPDFIAMAEAAVGATFDGYKGGEFTMTRDTPVWVANYGNSGNTAVVGVVDLGHQVMLSTGCRET